MKKKLRLGILIKFNSKLQRLKKRELFFASRLSFLLFGLFFSSQTVFANEDKTCTEFFSSFTQPQNSTEQAASSLQQNEGNKSIDRPKKTSAPITPKPFTEEVIKKAWQDSSTSLNWIRSKYKPHEHVIKSLAVAMLTREFVFIEGPPGRLLSEIPEQMFKASIKSIPEKDKKIFIQQMHQMITSGKILGFPKFKELYDKGRMEFETSSSLSADEVLFFILQEAHQSNAEVMSSLLSVLNERKRVQGHEVESLNVISGVLTSLKSRNQILADLKSRKTMGEALFDRMGVKVRMLPELKSENAKMANLLKPKEKDSEPIPPLPLHFLNPLIERITMSDEFADQLAQIVFWLDKESIKKSLASYSYGELNQSPSFSTRSSLLMSKIIKGFFVLEQLMAGKDFSQLRLELRAQDLHLIAKASLQLTEFQLTEKSFFIRSRPLSIPVKLESPFGSVFNPDFHYNPWKQELTLNSASSGGALRRKNQEERPIAVIRYTGEIIPLAERPTIGSRAIEDKASEIKKWNIQVIDEAFKDWNIRIEDPIKLKNFLGQWLHENASEIKTPRFTLDHQFAEYLESPTLSSGTKKDLLELKNDLVKLSEALNELMLGSESYRSTESKTLVKTPASSSFPRRSDETTAFLNHIRSPKLPKHEKLATVYEWVRQEVQGLKQTYLEMDYVIEAILTSLLAREHVFLQGPPGGAKTEIAEAILQGVLAYQNKESAYQFTLSLVKNLNHTSPQILNHLLNKLEREKPKAFKRFYLQFHPMITAGAITGFSKLSSVLETGKEETVTETSLAHKEFLYAILDEINNANPQVSSAVASILQDGTVKNGHEIISSHLISAILTSNKMMGEFIDSHKDQSRGAEALLAQVLNIVIVSGKLAEKDNLKALLLHSNSQANKAKIPFLPIHELESLSEQVELAHPGLLRVMLELEKKFLAHRLREAENSRLDFLELPEVNPYYYIPATYLKSDHSDERLFSQLKARFITHQLLNNVPYHELRMVIDFQDLKLFYEGLAYWGPQKISVDMSTLSTEGYLNFKAESDLIKKLRDDQRLDARTEYYFTMLEREASIFAELLTDLSKDFYMNQNKDYSLFLDAFEPVEKIDTKITGLIKLRIYLDDQKYKTSWNASLDKLEVEFQTHLNLLFQHLEEKKGISRTNALEKFKQLVRKAQLNRRSMEAKKHQNPSGDPSISGVKTDVEKAAHTQPKSSNAQENASSKSSSDSRQSTSGFDPWGGNRGREPPMP